MKSEVRNQTARALNGVARAAVLGAVLSWSSCATPDRTVVPVEPGHLISHGQPPIHSNAAAGAPTIVVVALDGVRWQDVFRGVDAKLARAQGMHEAELISARALLPNLHALIDRGVALGTPEQGPRLVASGPNFVSVPGYMEMFTGRSPTGCTTNGCDTTTITTIADDFAALAGDPLEVGVIASWEGVGRAASRDAGRLTVSVGRSQGASRQRLQFDQTASALLRVGEDAGPEPGHGDFRRDAATAAIALHYLETIKPRFLFLGLGETDEYGHRDDYRGYLRALSYADQVIGQVMQQLGRLQRDGRRATLFVTTDHGRSADFSGHGADSPESSRVWLIAAGAGIRRGSPAASRGQRHLADLAATVRALGGIGSAHASSRPLDEILLPPEAALAALR